ALTTLRSRVWPRPVGAIANTTAVRIVANVARPRNRAADNRPFIYTVRAKTAVKRFASVRRLIGWEGDGVGSRKFAASLLPLAISVHDIHTEGQNKSSVQPATSLKNP